VYAPATYVAHRNKRLKFLMGSYVATAIYQHCRGVRRVRRTSEQSDDYALDRRMMTPLDSYSAFFTCSRSFGAVPLAVTFPFSISAAHSAAPTVFVKANRIEATGTSSRSTEATPKLQELVHRHEQNHKGFIPRISPFEFFNMLLFLGRVPLLQLEVSRMRSRPSSPPL